MMSNFKIVHEIDGRLRVRFGQYAFTNEQATILKSDFLKLEYVRYVEAHIKMEVFYWFSMKIIKMKYLVI